MDFDLTFIHLYFKFSTLSMATPMDTDQELREFQREYLEFLDDEVRRCQYDGYP